VGENDKEQVRVNSGMGRGRKMDQERGGERLRRKRRGKRDQYKRKIMMVTGDEKGKAV
jgi:hypothetical protein